MAIYSGNIILFRLLHNDITFSLSSPYSLALLDSLPPFLLLSLLSCAVGYNVLTLFHGYVLTTAATTVQL